MIEFNCPSCQALIRVGEKASGKKGTCPSCRKKIVVPEKSVTQSPPAIDTPPIPSNPPEQSQSDNPPTFDPANVPTDPPAASAEPVIQIKPQTSPTRRRRKGRRRSSKGGLWVPVLCAGILFGFIGWYFFQINAGLSPEVTGTVVESPEIPPGLIARGDVTVDGQLYEKVRESLESEQLKLVGSAQLADVTLTAQQSGIVTTVKPAPGAMCVRVSLNDTDVADYVSEHAKELNQYRMQNIQETADEFITAWAAALETGEKTVPNLSRVRNQMALASVVSGFGYHVVAWDGKIASPCIGVGNSGELYFVLKPGTKSFIIRGRDVGSESAGFPGEIVVKVDRPEASTAPQPAPQEPEEM
ncbi:MAG: hypothetical protein HUJ26_18045 [Planctomycetaceae bacterium]|nr:hypothetical protein [Planctomycetaceae bacterium]